MRAHEGERVHARGSPAAVVHAEVTAAFDGSRLQAKPVGLAKSLNNPKAEAVVVNGGGGVAGGGWWLVAGRCVVGGGGWVVA